MTKTNEWFASWFDSPYYNILYQHRNFLEAEQFILHLLGRLAPQANARFLDLACGQGRHAYFINKQGFKVTGLDLAKERIAEAQLHANDALDFQVHDMRLPLPGKYNFIFNLFTSFGYFEEQQDNLKVLRNVRAGLLPGGKLVLDFLNVGQILANLVPEEKKQMQGIQVRLQRRVQDGFIIKDIEVLDGEETHHFQERVQAISKSHFEQLFVAAGLKVDEVWGDYSGSEWDEFNSPRLIFICSVLNDN